MTVSNPEGHQLELFDLSGHPTTRPRQPSLGRLVLQIRQDQVVVAGIAGLVGLTVVFALGVERGKQLVRSERVLLARQQQPQPLDTPAPTSRALSETGAVKTLMPSANATKSAPVSTPSSVKSTAPKKLVAATPGASRYAIQVVSYRRPLLAKREMERLHANGERAFLVSRNGLIVLCVGPFPSKDNAKEKLVQLKDRYQGCFLKTL